MRTFRVPIKVMMMGWVPVEAEGMNEATLIAEHMKNTCVRPKWDRLLRDWKESYVVETQQITEEEPQKVVELESA